MKLEVHFVLDQELSRVVFYPPLYGLFWSDFILSDHNGKEMGEQRIKRGGETFLDLDYVDDLSILDESLTKINEVLEILRVQGTRIDLKINFKKNKSLKSCNKWRWKGDVG